MGWQAALCIFMISLKPVWIENTIFLGAYYVFSENMLLCFMMFEYGEYGYATIWIEPFKFKFSIIFHCSPRPTARSCIYAIAVPYRFKFGRSKLCLNGNLFMKNTAKIICAINFPKNVAWSEMWGWEEWNAFQWSLHAFTGCI